jgi:hypothetical protein
MIMDVKQCCYCGRVGTRSFIRYDGGAWLCAKQRACNRRRGSFRRRRR